MKNIQKNNKGFTLLEIIIVIIIIGVLASLALPRFLKTVEYSRSAEALSQLSALRQSVNRCWVADKALPAACQNLAGLDVEDPSANPGTHFTYALNVADPNLPSFTITATRNATDGGDGVSTVVLQDAGGTVTKSGTGQFSGVH